jgi:hypothetical protein
MYSSVMRGVVGGFKYQAPNLRYLCIRRPWNASIAEIEDTQEYLHNLYVPALEHLELIKMPYIPWNCPLLHSASASLRSLVISHEYRPTPTTIVATLKALRGMKSLRSLTWTGRLPEEPLHSRSSSSLRAGSAPIMPQLHELVLGGTAAGCLTVLRHIAPAKPVKMTIRSDDDEVFVQIWEIVALKCLEASTLDPVSNGSLRIAYLGNQVEVVASPWRSNPLTVSFRVDNVRRRLHIVKTLIPWLARIKPGSLQLEMSFGEHYMDKLGSWQDILAHLPHVRRLHLRRTSGATLIMRAIRAYALEAGSELLPNLETMIIEGTPNYVDGPWLGACCAELERRKSSGASKLTSILLQRCVGITREELHVLRKVDARVSVTEIACFEEWVDET